MKTEVETFYGVSDEDLENRIHWFLDQTGIGFVDGDYYMKDDESEFAFVMIYAVEKGVASWS